MSAGELDLIVVRDETGLLALMAYVLSGDRTRPVVALTRSVEADGPVLAPTDVRAVVGPDVRIYYLPRGFLLRRLEGVLGGRLAMARGAIRVWWPGLSIRSDPGDHPLVLALEGEEERELLGEFARQFDLSRPLVRREVKLIEQTRRLAERELTQARQQNRDMKIACHQALMRVEAAEASCKTSMRQSEEMDCQEMIHGCISSEWRGALSPSDRCARPLGGYVLAPEFVAVVEQQPDLPVDRLAWMCAMVACGYAPMLTAVALQPLSATPGGSQIERADGAVGWRCSLQRHATAGPHVDYWIAPDGVIEFAGLADHEDLDPR